MFRTGFKARFAMLTGGSFRSTQFSLWGYGVMLLRSREDVLRGTGDTLLPRFMAFENGSVLSVCGPGSVTFCFALSSYWGSGIRNFPALKSLGIQIVYNSFVLAAFRLISKFGYLTLFYNNGIFSICSQLGRMNGFTCKRLLIRVLRSSEKMYGRRGNSPLSTLRQRDYMLFARKGGWRAAASQMTQPRDHMSLFAS